MPILRLAYTTLFLIALLAVFESWSQVGGQSHLDLMPWYLKLVLGAGAAFSVVKAAVAAVAGERAWNRQTLRWAGILLAFLIGCGLASYYAHLYLEEEEQEEQNVSRSGRVLSQWCWSDAPRSGCLPAARLREGLLAVAERTPTFSKIRSMTPTAFVVAPGGSRSRSNVASSGKISVKVSGKDNGGSFAVLEVATEMDAGSPLHVHHVENEWFYALEGEYDIQVGDQIYRLEPGASVYGPKLIPHAWHDVGVTAGKMLVVVQPAGNIEAFSEELEKLGPGGDPDPAVFKAFFEKHDMEIVGPPLPKKLVR
jgi:mannose-6-phosphate isomerase-like protein (cupin superfamily)